MKVNFQSEIGLQMARPDARIIIENVETRFEPSPPLTTKEIVVVALKVGLKVVLSLVAAAVCLLLIFLLAGWMVQSTPDPLSRTILSIFIAYAGFQLFVIFGMIIWSRW